ncbi:universal stress protein [Halobacteria archaeon AArc-m2/3/4]|uniref:Universal stress protein n=1 Tax=Natronoglomus mannanivorans TaxID=2979990 RepID=A0ABT2QG74_9EURY|nr:universal stress protein [Halobacteria archaeon AArc-m2/3/4]
MFDRFLVPFDGSGPATAALELVTQIAIGTDATVHLLYVRDPDEGDDEAIDATGRTGEEALSAARDRTSDTDVTVVSDVIQGEPREQILEYATANDVDVICMGSHGRQGLGRFVLGSVAEGVVRDAPVPVLVVRASDDVHEVYPFERILVPTDGSEHAELAIDRGIELAIEYGASLHLLSVVDLSPYAFDASAAMVTDRLEANAKTALEKAAETAADEGLDVQTTVEFGAAHRAISSYAEDEGMDLLVMGTHGHSGLDRYLLGSVTERVLRTAPAPVLTERVPEDE